MTKQAKMISIWHMVGFVLTIYGILVTSMGIYYVFYPETQSALAELNPSLWWGIIMLVFGLVMWIGAVFVARKQVD